MLPLTLLEIMIWEWKAQFGSAENLNITLEVQNNMKFPETCENLSLSGMNLWKQLMLCKEFKTQGLLEFNMFNPPPPLVSLVHIGFQCLGIGSRPFF